MVYPPKLATFVGLFISLFKQQKYPTKGRWQRNKNVDSLDAEKLGEVRRRKLKAKEVSALGKILYITFTTLEDVSNVCAVQQTPPAEQSGNLSLSRTDKVSKVVCSWTHAILL